jgi:hypothetical protein
MEDWFRDAAFGFSASRTRLLVASGYYLEAHGSANERIDQVKFRLITHTPSNCFLMRK